MPDRLATAVAAHQKAQAELAVAQAAVVKAQQEHHAVRARADAARRALADEIRAAHQGGARVADLARLTGYGRENIKRIVGSTPSGDDDEEP